MVDSDKATDGKARSWEAGMTSSPTWPDREFDDRASVTAAYVTNLATSVVPILSGTAGWASGWFCWATPRDLRTG